MENLTEIYIDEQPIFYGGFWRRFGAQFVDGLLLCLILIPATWYNLIELKSYPLNILVALLGTLYKPLMEYKYGATLGKMAFSLKCVDESYDKMNLSQAFSRNLLFIVPSIITISLNYFVFSNPVFASASSYTEVVKVLAQFRAVNWVNYLSYFFWIIDAIVLGSDNRKRSLHDRWAGTFVIYTPS